MVRGVLILLVLAALGPQEKKSAREALQAFNDLIGPWRAAGTPEGTAQEKQRGFWKETVNWGWQFKGDDAWLVVAFGRGKHFKNGELRYLPDQDRYRFSVATTEGKQLEFEGVLKGRSLILERRDPDSKETQRLTISLVGDIRFTYRYEVKPANRTLFTRVYEVGATKEGESLAGTTEKRPICPVSGGLGTMAVSYMGQTYYVCCTGCRDAWNENPEKYIKEMKDKAAKEKK